MPYCFDNKLATNNMIENKNIELDILKLFIGFVYGDKIQIYSINYLRFQTANFLQVVLDSIQNVCLDFMMETIYPGLILKVRTFDWIENYLNYYFQEFNNSIVEEFMLSYYYEKVMKWIDYDSVYRGNTVLPVLLTEMEKISKFTSNDTPSSSVACSVDEGILDDLNSTESFIPNNDVIYIVGGVHKDVELYSNDNKTLNADVVISMSCKRFGLVVTKYQNHIFCVGGCDIDSNNHDILSSMELFNIETMEWSRNVNNMSYKRLFHAGCTIGDYIYVCGGDDDSGSLSSAEKYSPSTNQWFTIESMRNKRSDVGLATLNGCVWVVGGRDGDILLNSVESYDPRTSTWNYETPMSNKRCQFGITAVNDNKIFVCGGWDENETGDNLDTLEEYDIRTKRWTSLASMNHKRYALSLIEFEGKLFAIGGSGGYKEVEIFHRNENRWSLGKKLNTDRHGFGSVVLPYCY